MKNNKAILELMEILSIGFAAGSLLFGIEQYFKISKIYRQTCVDIDSITEVADRLLK